MSTPVATPPEPQIESRQQRIRVRGEELLAKVREIIHQGNARRIIVINDEGHTLIEIPLTAGVIGAIVAPVLVAVGAIAALAQDYTLLIEAHLDEPRPAPRRAVAPKRSRRANGAGTSG